MIRQTIKLILEDKAFSLVYTAGTTVAIASAMVVAIVLHIMSGDITPETRRTDTRYVNGRFEISLNGKNNWQVFSMAFADECVKTTEGVEIMCMTTSTSTNDFRSEGQLEPSELVMRFVNDGFFKLHQFDFISGAPFSEQQMDNDENCVVITDKAAMDLFETTDNVVGQTIMLGFEPYKVIGLVHQTSALLSMSYAEVYIPYTCMRMPKGDEQLTYGRGNTPVVDISILPMPGYTSEMIEAALDQKLTTYCDAKSQQLGTEIKHTISVTDKLGSQFIAEERKLIYLAASIFMLALMLLPAINLSGVVSNRMEDRLPELGIRKAYGASRHTLLMKVITENLMLTIIGGIFGYIVASLFISHMADSAVFSNIFDNHGISRFRAKVDFEMFISPVLFLATFVCCAIFNLMVALIPAIRALRKPLINSLNQKV